MNQQEKNAIIKLKNKGVSLGEIAKELGLSKSTVSTFMVRHASKEGRCENCQAPFTQRGNKRFCSDKCRITWWNHHRSELNHIVFHTYTCLGCGKQFTTTRKSRNKYCSRECYLNHAGGESHEQG